MSREEASRIARAADRVRRSPGGALKVALPTAAVLGAGAAVAIGSIPGSNGVITACYNTVDQSAAGGPPNTNVGAVRLIDPSTVDHTNTLHSSCATDEATVTWNMQGSPGPQGATGPSGAPGVPGGAGPQGLRGLQGISAPTVPQGALEFAPSGGGGGAEFLKIPGILGGATDKLHSGQIEISSFSFGVANPTTIGSATGGAGAGKVKFGEIHVTKAFDKSSPALAKLSLNGNLLPAVQISAAKVHKGKEVDYLQFKLSDVTISTVQLSGGGGGLGPTESLSLNFTKIEIDYLQAAKVKSSIKLNAIQLGQ